MKTYAGIGSRATPQDALDLIQRIAVRLASRGYTLNSGGADGADLAFQCGAGEQSNIFLPWPGFNGQSSQFEHASSEAFEIASRYHPGWPHLKRGARALMARNTHQILGHDLCHPVAFVVCWTKDGAETAAQRSRATGGTGQAIAIASDHGISVFNLKNPDAIERLGNLVLATELCIDEQLLAPQPVQAKTIRFNTK